jgi:hypothetical protein
MSLYCVAAKLLRPSPLLLIPLPSNLPTSRLKKHTVGFKSSAHKKKSQ